MESILAEDMKFVGPFFRGESAQEYLAGLRKNPPAGMAFEVLHAYEDASSACVVYRFEKEEVSTPMAQIFEVQASKISAITLIFDSKEFA